MVKIVIVSDTVFRIYRTVQIGIFFRKVTDGSVIDRTKVLNWKRYVNQKSYINYPYCFQEKLTLLLWFFNRPILIK